MDDPLLELTDDPGGEDQLSGWMTDTDTLVQLTTLGTGTSILKLTAPSIDPLAVPDAVRVIDWLRAGTDGPRITLARPSHLRGTASPRPAGGIIPTPHCTDHGTTTAPAMEWHPAGGIRCADLTP